MRARAALVVNALVGRGHLAVFKGLSLPAVEARSSRALLGTYRAARLCCLAGEESAAREWALGCCGFRRRRFVVLSALLYITWCTHTHIHTHTHSCPFVSHPFLCWYLLLLVVPWKWHPRKQRHNLLATLHHSAPSSACCRTAFSMRCDDGRRRSRCVDVAACHICAWPSPAAFTTGACTPGVLRFPFYLLVRAPSPFSPSARRSPGAARR